VIIDVVHVIADVGRVLVDVVHVTIDVRDRIADAGRVIVGARADSIDIRRVTIARPNICFQSALHAIRARVGDFFDGPVSK